MNPGRRVQGTAITFTPDHACGMVVFRPAQVRNLVQILGPVKEPVDGDGILKRLAVDKGQLGCRWLGSFSYIVEQRLLPWSRCSALDEASCEDSQTETFECLHRDVR